MLTNDNYVFKCKSCEAQFKFNIKLSTKLKDADSAVKSGDAVAASETTSEGLDLLSYRQKVIGLADSSDLGWSAVKEYQADPLASDSKDEKHMMRAEDRASRKLKQRRFKKARHMPQRFQPYKQPTATLTATTSGQLQQGNVIPTLRPVRRGRLGVCYGCGKSGHWKFESLAGENTFKVYR